MKELEKRLDEVFVKNASFQLPENARKWIAEYAWIFGLVGLILGLMAVLPLLAGLGLLTAFGTALGAGRYVVLAWLSFLVLCAYLVVLAISIPKLKRKEAAGWNLTYYSTLVFFVYDVVYALASLSAAAVFGLIWNLICVGVALYVLFQVRPYFKGAKKPNN